MKKRIALLLVAAQLVLALAACSEKDDGKESTPTGGESTPAANETETEPQTETEEPDPFADVNYDGRALRVYTSIDTNDATNGDRFIRGTGEITGEAVNDAVYNRNQKVSNLLGITLEYVEANYYYDAVVPNLKTEIQGGSNDWDVIANDLRAIANLSSGGFIKNIYSTDILSLDKSYWYGEAMDDLQFIEGGKFCIVGDYFTDALASAHTLYVNEKKMNDLYGDSNYVNKMVFDGTWTIDEWTKIVDSAYDDLNGNGETDSEDFFGYTSIGYWGPGIPVLMGLDIKFVDKTADGVTFAFNNEKSISVLEKLNNLFYSTGTNAGLGDVAGMRTNFANGSTLFMGYNRLGDMEYLRDIEFEVGVVPYPKYDTDQANYNTSLHDTTEIGAIPSFITGDDLNFVLTCLEVLGRETSKTVIPEFYENGLKVKYADGQDDAKMIDIIHDSICSPFAIAYDSTLGNFLLRNCMLDRVAEHSTDFASAYKRYEKGGSKLLERTYESFKGVIERDK